MPHPLLPCMHAPMQAFFEALQHLAAQGAPFRVVVVGEQFHDAPAVFEAAHGWLLAGGHIWHWGFVQDQTAYRALVAGCDVVVSTAIHEVRAREGVKVAGCMPHTLALCVWRV